MRRPVSRLRPLLVVLALCLPLAACGQSEEPSAVAEPQIGEAERAAAGGGGGSRAGADDMPERAGEGPSLEEVDPTEPPEVGARRRQACIGTDFEPTRTNLADVRRATLCLLNAERAARNLPPLRANDALARAALGHARDMVVNDYFSHESRSGADVVARIRDAGYLRGRSRWTVGENLAWGVGRKATPSEIVRSWMDSPGHRANILHRAFDEVGVGVTLGVPQPGMDGGATYNTGFGAR